jgi:hypothetical protein
MTAHAETHALETAHASHSDGGDPRLQAALALKFEPSELRDFDLADKAAGQMMGKLLAFLFCVLLFLMTGVNIWMIGNQAKGTDPQAPIGVQADAGHHGDAAHDAAPAHH